MFTPFCNFCKWFVYCERLILFVFDVKGADENFGLGMLAMEEVLRNVEGGRHTVAVSIYEVLQNHVYDLLDTNNKEVKILEDAQGKITLKGLSKAS